MRATENNAQTFRLPWPPTVNNYWSSRILLPRGWGPYIQRVVGREVWAKISRMFIGKQAYPRLVVTTTKKAQRYRVDVQAAILSRFGVIRPTEARLRVTILAVMPDRRVRDLSNLLKAAEDAMTASMVWGDDKQIDDIRVIRGPVEPPGYLEVTVERITDPQGKLFA